ncbi:hypothetical protein GCM10027361_26030 [Erwinia aphidicola]
MSLHSRFQLGIIALSGGEVGFLRGENRISLTRRQLYKGSGSSGLKCHRVALRWARHIERATALEPRSIDVGIADTFTVRIDPLLAIGHDSVIRPAVPKRAHRLNKRCRLLISQLMA